MTDPLDPIIWEGVYNTFNDVVGATGYFNNEAWIQSQVTILESILRSISNNHTVPEINSDQKQLLPLLASLLSGQLGHPLSILDYGGGIGIDFVNTIRCIGNDKILKYFIIETDRVCEVGSTLFKNHLQVEFHSTVPENKVDIVYLDSSLQYVEDYRSLLSKLCQCQPEFFLFLRTPAGNIPTYVSAQVNMTDGIIPYRFFNFNELCIFMKNYGYIHSFSSYTQRIYNQSNFPMELRLGRAKNILFSRHK